MIAYELRFVCITCAITHSVLQQRRHSASKMKSLRFQHLLPPSNFRFILQIHLYQSRTALITTLIATAERKIDDDLETIVSYQEC